VVKRLFRPRASRPTGEPSQLRLEAERGQRLVEESRELVVVVDQLGRIVAASRRAREALDGVVEGALFPARYLEIGESAPLRIAYEVDGHRETLIYLGYPGDLAAYEELRTGFTAAVSHELRTPLARLMALLESTELAGSDPVALVRRARGEADQIRELIDDVLFLSELESGREVVSLGAIRALPVLERAMESLAARAERADVTLRLVCSASAELPLRERMLEIVATNLAENAIRYAGSGSTFSLIVAEADDGMRLTGLDDGVGVSDENLPRLFERFFRTDEARATRGTGLGLAIVKHVVTAAGGTIEAAHTPGGGLEVTCLFTTP
jgi:signal transduction histidine kinase